MLMVSPGVYLVLRLLNMRPPALLVYLVYLAVFVLWFLGPIFSPLGFMWLEAKFPSPYGPDRVLLVAQGMTLVINAAAFGSWLVWWSRRNPSPEESNSVLPHLGYVLPFFAAPAGLAVWRALGFVEDWLRVA